MSLIWIIHIIIHNKYLYIDYISYILYIKNYLDISIAISYIVYNSILAGNQNTCGQNTGPVRWSFSVLLKTGPVFLCHKIWLPSATFLYVCRHLFLPATGGRSAVLSDIIPHGLSWDLPDPANPKSRNRSALRALSGFRKLLLSWWNPSWFFFFIWIVFSVRSYQNVRKKEIMLDGLRCFSRSFYKER